LGGVKITLRERAGGVERCRCLTHAVIDALLGAARWETSAGNFRRGIPSIMIFPALVLLGKRYRALKINGWNVGNVDITIIAEEPKLSGYITV